MRPDGTGNIKHETRGVLDAQSFEVIMHFLFVEGALQGKGEGITYS